MLLNLEATMKELFVLAWHSYDELSTDLDGAVVGVYETLQQAQEAMTENAEETASFYENGDYSLDIEDTSAAFSTPNGYLIKYYITNISV